MKKKQKICASILIVMLLFGIITVNHLYAQIQIVQEKECLSEKDLSLALLSQGIIMRQIKGDFTPLTALQQTPYVYRTNGITMLVYVYDDIFKRRFSIPKLSFEQYQEVIGIPVSHVFDSAIRNMVIVYLCDDEADFGVCHRIENTIDERLNTFIENTLQKEKDGVRFTIKQRYYANTLLDKINNIEMVEYKTIGKMSCQYIEPTAMAAQELTLGISIDNRSYSTNCEWDGQDNIEIDLGNGRCLVEKINEPPVYDIVFSHGDKQIQVQIDQSNILIETVEI